MARKIMTTPNVTTSAKLATTRSTTKPSRTANASGYATLVQDLYERARELMDELATGDGDISKRAIALNTVAKSLPLIRAAEEAASSHIRARDKDIKALSDAELRELAAGVTTPQVAQTLDSPASAEARAGVPSPAQKSQNQFSENINDSAELSSPASTPGDDE